MNSKPAADVVKRPVCAWLSESDYAKFEAIVECNGVSVSAYLRSMVVDVIAEETSKRVEVVDRKLAVVR